MENNTSPGGRVSTVVVIIGALLLACVGMPWVYFVRDYDYVQGTARRVQDAGALATEGLAWGLIGLLIIGGAVGFVAAIGTFTRWASPKARAASLEIALARAQHQELPDGLHSLTIQAPRAREPLAVELREPAPQLTEEPAAPALPPPHEHFAYGVPRLQQLIDRKDVTPGATQLLMGYAGQQPRYIRAPEWGLMIVAGQSGKGKSSAAALLIGQAALSGWTIFICDPSYRRDRSLLRQQLATMTGAIYRQAIEPEQIAHTVELVTKIARRRIDYGETGERILLVVDDFSSVAGRGVVSAEALTDLFLTATQASAAGVHTLLIAHDLRGAWFGGVVARQGRDQATHRLIFNMNPDAAAPILPSSEEARQVAVLPVGQALYFDGGDEPALLRLPHLTAEDLAPAAQGRPPQPYQPWTPKPAQVLASAAPTPPPPAPVQPSPAPRPMARPAASQTTILDWTAAEKIMDALAAAPAGLDAQSVADRTGAALSVVKARLAELKAEGFIDARKVPGSRSFLYTLVRRPKVA